MRFGKTIVEIQKSRKLMSGPFLQLCTIEYLIYYCIKNWLIKANKLIRLSILECEAKKIGTKGGIPRSILPFIISSSSACLLGNNHSLVNVVWGCGKMFGIHSPGSGTLEVEIYLVGNLELFTLPFCTRALIHEYFMQGIVALCSGERFAYAISYFSCFWALCTFHWWNSLFRCISSLYIRCEIMTRSDRN